MRSEQGERHTSFSPPCSNTISNTAPQILILIALSSPPANFSNTSFAAFCTPASSRPCEKISAFKIYSNRLSFFSNSQPLLFSIFETKWILKSLSEARTASDSKAHACWIDSSTERIIFQTKKFSSLSKVCSKARTVEVLERPDWATARASAMSPILSLIESKPALTFWASILSLAGLYATR
jgi:hypothetical protein